MLKVRPIKLGDYDHILIGRDPESGFRGMVAVHDTGLGPALGGLRRRVYGNEVVALTEALRLARGITYTAAIAGLPLGGAQAVIAAEPDGEITQADIDGIGQMVQRLGGRAVLCEDLGVERAHMLTLADTTAHVAGLAATSAEIAEAAAYGVFLSMRAALKQRRGQAAIDGARVAVQGVGRLGYRLCAYLHDAGASLVVSDPDPTAAERAVESFGATAIAPHRIYDIDADLFAPCAISGVINGATVKRLAAGIVAGGASDQLSDPWYSTDLHRRGILYLPDYVINAGGMIAGSWEMRYPGEAYDHGRVMADVERIEQRLLGVLKRAEINNIATAAVADSLARERQAIAVAA